MRCSTLESVLSALSAQGSLIYFIDSNNNGALDGGEIKTTTNAYGNYSLASVPAGSYVLRYVNQSGYRATNPSSGYRSVSLAAGQTLTSNFGVTNVAGVTRCSIDSSRRSKAAGLRCAGRLERRVLVCQRLDSVTLYSPDEDVEGELGL